MVKANYVSMRKMTNTKKLTKKEPSKKLRKAIDDMVDCFQKTATSIDSVFSIGREEGFSDMEIGNMIRKGMLAANYDSRTIRRALPLSAKHIEKIRRRKAFADKMSANEHEDGVNMQPAQRSDNDQFITDHIAQHVEPKAYELPTMDWHQQSVTEQSKPIVQDRREFELDRILKSSVDNRLIKFEILIPKDIVWQYIEERLYEDNNSEFWINGLMNQESGNIMSLAFGRTRTS